MIWKQAVKANTEDSNSHRRKTMQVYEGHALLFGTGTQLSKKERYRKKHKYKIKRVKNMGAYPQIKDIFPYECGKLSYDINLAAFPYSKKFLSS